MNDCKLDDDRWTSPKRRILDREDLVEILSDLLRKVCPDRDEKAVGAVRFRFVTTKSSRLALRSYLSCDFTVRRYRRFRYARLTEIWI